MAPQEPFPLHHSWPLYERDARLDLGLLLDSATDGVAAGAGTTGHWHCDLASGQLTWAPGVRELFGMAPDAAADRTHALWRYEELSRAAMERLRAHAIRHCRGFTIDVALRDAGVRWMRLVAAPIVTDRRVIGLCGWKTDVSALYR
ncbi:MULTISPECIES: hypothetical protein [Sphingomonas]|jgi:PAS domain-containing protein|uniref:Diguanylate cyclase n=1 Tax=Sphingomonas ginsenosidimutans TaxID=862134 RepID=A0A2A4HWX1_9SPHN|nr:MULTISPECIES: hypothetical protein [Sphingomonas]MBY0302881.1 hypothetical protein [Sphingomonas ginsenosidimutans]PCG08389.1 hypothetical protein COA17_13575 [Sphingomonas ginsenosidimutans]